MTTTHRHRLTWRQAGILGLSAATVAPLTALATPAAAIPGCNQAPAIDETITCEFGAEVTIPAGAESMDLTVIGGGGGGAFQQGATVARHAGSGAVVTATATWPDGTTSLDVVVGAGGGIEPSHVAYAGEGGDGSGVFAYDQFDNLLADLIVAGGGGGAGAGAYLEAGAGGNAGTDGGVAPNGGDSATGGGAAIGDTGGAGGAVDPNVSETVAGNDGTDHVNGQIAPPTFRTNIVGPDVLAGGGGGGGYASGGSGGGLNLWNAYSEYTGGGGGGGSSYANPSYTTGVSMAISDGTTGYGFRGDSDSNDDDQEPGEDGAVILTFRASVAQPAEDAGACPTDHGWNVVVDQVARLYQSSFGRSPDGDGLAYWTRARLAGLGAPELAGLFLASSERTMTSGSSQSDADFLEGLYQDVLGRSADHDGLAYWVGQLGSGLDRAHLLLLLSDSAEHVASTETRSPMTDHQAMTCRMYQTVFHRSPDDGGFDYWVSLLDGGLAPGEVARWMLANSEASGVAAVSDTDFVDHVYDGALHRSPDSGGRTFWAGRAGSDGRHVVVVELSNVLEGLVG